MATNAPLTKITVQNRENFNQLKKKLFILAQKHPIVNTKDKSNKFMIEFDIMAESIFSKVQANVLVEGKEYEDREEELDKELTERVKIYEQKLKVLSDRIKKKRESVTSFACKTVDTKLNNDAPQLTKTGTTEDTMEISTSVNTVESSYKQFESQQVHNTEILSQLSQKLPATQTRAQNLVQISNDLNSPASQTERVIKQDLELFSSGKFKTTNGHTIAKSNDLLDPHKFADTTNDFGFLAPPFPSEYELEFGTNKSNDLYRTRKQIIYSKIHPSYRRHSRQ